jgi:hypothetical protein
MFLEGVVDIPLQDDADNDLKVPRLNPPFDLITPNVLVLKCDGGDKALNRPPLARLNALNNSSRDMASML